MPRRPRPKDGPPAARLIALFAAAMVLFNFPMLAVFDSDVTVLGLPLLPVALFSGWAGLILALALVSERRGRRGAPPPAHDAGQKP